ncbi:MAG: hypothetical protein ACE5GV_09430 [Candidatus Scalindua sp.]
MKIEEIYKKSLELHKLYKGKIQVVSKVPFKGLDDDNIVPRATDTEVGPRVAAAVAAAAIKSGAARIKLSEEEVMKNTRQKIEQHKLFMETVLSL